jgi:arylsulfatase
VLVAAAATGCGSGDDGLPAGAVAAGAVPVQHRLFRGAADQEVIDRIEHLRDQPGRLIASWTFSSPDELGPFKLRGSLQEPIVQGGVLRVPAAGKGARGRSLDFEPPAKLPPVFRVEVKLAPEQPSRHVPSGLLWTSGRHRGFHKWRRAHAVVADDPAGSASTASYEVVYWHGPIKRLRLEFRGSGRPIEVDEISIHAPELRTAAPGSGGAVWAEIDGVTMPSVWAAPPSRLEATVHVPANGRLTFSTGVAAEYAGKPASAVVFEAFVQDERAFTRTVRVGGRKRAGWKPARVELGRWAGQRVRLVLETSLAGDAGGPTPPLAFWGAPGVVAVHEDEPAPTVVLVVMDTTRADHLSLYGYDLETTPFLRELGERSVVFDAAFSQSPWTMPSMCSMLTSAEPWEMNTIWGTPGRIPEEFPTLAELLAAKGYLSGAFLANLVLAPDHGYARGFDAYAYPRQEMADGADVTDQALAWVGAHPGEPLFLWVHYIDPHAPYEPPQKSLEAVLRSAAAPASSSEKGAFPPRDHVDAARLMRHYDGEIRWVDEQIRRLYDGIRRDHGREPLFVVAADHGEAFLEHGFYAHGASLHSEETHVPLLICWHGVLNPRRIERPVRNLDILPTMLDLLGAAPLLKTAGISLRPVIDGIEIPLEAYSEGNSHGPRRAAVRDRSYTYMTFEAWDPLGELKARPNPDVAWRLRHFLPPRALYVRDGDDSEDRNVVALHPDIAARMQRSIDRVEMQRHGGIVVRLRGRLDDPARSSVTLSGRLSVKGARLADVRTRMADAASDEFSLDGAATSVGFSCFLHGHDEEWLLFDATDDDARFSLELTSAGGPRPRVILGAETVSLIDGRLEFDARSATVDLATAEGHFDDEPASPLVQVWKLDVVGRRYEASTIPQEVLGRLRALGYVGGDDGDE